MSMNYGFDEDAALKAKESDPTAYILGVNSKLPTTIIRPDGQWPDILYEPQAAKFETSGCTIWGMENQVEMFMKEVFGFEPNYDERFTYLHCNVNPSIGADPQNAYESARHDGLIPNELMPNTLADFLDKKYLTPLRMSAGKEWVGRFELLHDWLTDTTKETIKSALALSPIAIAVTAWSQDEHGLYVDRGMRNTHWCVARGYVSEYNGVKGIILKVFDTYDYSTKYLHPNHRISMAKRIYIKERDELTEEQGAWILQKLKEILVALNDSFRRVRIGLGL